MRQNVYPLELFYDNFNIKDNSTIPNARRSRQLTQLYVEGGLRVVKAN